MTKQLLATDLETLAAEVKAYTAKHLNRYIDELTKLCAIDSPSYHKQGLDEIASYLATRLRNIGMQATVIEHEEYGNDVLGIVRGGGQGKVLLLGHIDTVYPVGTATNRPVRVHGNMAYGPGVNDMRGGVLSGVYAIEALLAANYHSFGEIRFLCVSDEEISTRHSEELLRETAQGCQAAFILEASRDNGDIVSARKGLTTYELAVHGHAAHAGVEPDKGVSAILELAHQILQFQQVHGWREGVTINTGVISGGMALNVVPDFAQASIELRYLHPQDRIATEARWAEIMQQKLLPKTEITLHALITTRSHPLVCTPESLILAEQAQNIAHMLGFSVKHVLTGGVSDANCTANYGIPSLDGLGPIGGLDHSPDEYLMIDSVAPRTALLAGLIVRSGS